MQTTDHDKANTLSHYVKSIFTNDQLPIPTKCPPQLPSVKTLDIGIYGIIKQLETLKPNRASDLDDIPERVLTESEISTIIQHIFQGISSNHTPPVISHKPGPQFCHTKSHHVQERQQKQSR